MILDKLVNITTYSGISGNLDPAIDYLVQNCMEALPLGRHHIHGAVRARLW